MKGNAGRDEVKNLDMVLESSHGIAWDSSESAYSWDIGRVGRTKIVNDRTSVD